MFNFHPVLPLKSLAAARVLSHCQNLPPASLPVPLQPLATGEMEGTWLKWKEEEEWIHEDGRKVTLKEIVEVETMTCKFLKALEEDSDRDMMQIDKFPRIINVRHFASPIIGDLISEINFPIPSYFENRWKLCSAQNALEGNALEEIHNLDLDPQAFENIFHEDDEEEGILQQSQSWIDPTGAPGCSASLCKLIVYDQVWTDVDKDDLFGNNVGFEKECMVPSAEPGGARAKMMIALEKDMLILKVWGGMMKQYNMPVLVKRIFFKRL